MEVQGQYLACSTLRYDVSQTIPSQEIKYANLSIQTAGDDTEIHESQRSNPSADKPAISVTGVRGQMR